MPNFKLKNLMPNMLIRNATDVLIKNICCFTIFTEYFIFKVI